jgi:hypothetical protein
LVPRSEAWYEFYWEKMDRLLAGEDIGMRIPLEAFDEMMRRGELADAERKAADPGRIRGREAGRTARDR